MSESPRDAEVAAAVHDRELARRAAMLAGDAAALDDLLDEEAQWIHGSAVIDSKRSFLTAIGSGAVRYTALDGEDETYRVIAEDVVLARCVIRMRSEAGGVARAPLTLLNTLVWRRREGVWRIVGYQSTLVP